MPFLEILDGKRRKLMKLAATSVVLGRSSSADVQIFDEKASRHHCVVERGAGGWLVRDLDSRNGTRVDGKLASATVLTDGAAIEIGRTVIRFLLNDPRGDLNAAAPASPQEPAPTAGAGDDEGPDLPPLTLDPAAAPEPAVDPAAAPIVLPDDAFRPMAPLQVAPQAVSDNLGPDLLAGSASDPFAAIVKFLKPHRQQPVHEGQVELINARGVVVHAAGLMEEAQEQTEGDTNAEVGMAVRLLRCLLLAAYHTHASDLHFEMRDRDCSIRLRVDGGMVEIVRILGTLGIRLYGVVKVLGDIDIAQRGIVQEGHFTARFPDRRVDYRVSFTPAMYGQKLVLRVLDPYNAPQRMEQLNLPDWMLARVQQVSLQSAGMLLSCGPTGSGKTTTLYAVLRDIDRQRRNVITIEDPVEYQLDGVTQIPINEQKGNTFHSLLRSVLRQDPDVILLGEIRDRETAETAMQAAMTGHLVLSTVHAKDTIGTLFRLLDLGAEPYLVASSLNLVLAQRLVRMLCPACRAPRRPTPKQLHQMKRTGREIKAIYYPVGCPRCFDAGYHGRQGLYELLEMTNDLRDALLKSATMAALRDALERTSFVSLQEMGYRYVAEGITSPDEIERAVGGV